MLLADVLMGADQDWLMLEGDSIESSIADAGYGALLHETGGQLPDFADAEELAEHTRDCSEVWGLEADGAVPCLEDRGKENAQPGMALVVHSCSQGDQLVLSGFVDHSER